MIKRRARAIYNAAMLTFGADMQLTVANEELAELQQQICKMKRGKLDKRHLTEEIADALNVIEQVIIMAEISEDEIRGYKNRKLHRLIKTIAEEKNSTEEETVEWIRGLETI